MRLTDYLATYGAILSTAVFLWNAVRSLPRFRIRIAYAGEGRGESFRSGVGISIQNPSSQPVHINVVSLVYPYRHVGLLERVRDALRFPRMILRNGWCHVGLSIHDVDDECPATIEPGKSHYIFVSDEVLAEVFDSALRREFRATAQDALYRNIYSPTFKYDLPLGATASGSEGRLDVDGD